MENVVLLIVAQENYSGIAFTTMDVILKENSIDIVVASTENATARADDGSSTMTVSFEEILPRLSDYVGLVLIDGGMENLKANPGLGEILQKIHHENKLIGVVGNTIEILEELRISGANILKSDDDLENFAESYAIKIVS
jgi:hypothetical protein